MNRVEIRKNGGFYLVFGDDTFIIHYFFGYKIKDDGCIGFPLAAYDKVIGKLDELNINYCVSSNNIEKDFGKKNRYDEFVLKGKKKFDIGFRIDQIVLRLERFSEADIDRVIDFIEEIGSKYEG